MHKQSSHAQIVRARSRASLVLQHDDAQEAGRMPRERLANRKSRELEARQRQRAWRLRRRRSESRSTNEHGRFAHGARRRYIIGPCGVCSLVRAAAREERWRLMPNTNQGTHPGWQKDKVPTMENASVLVGALKRAGINLQHAVWHPCSGFRRRLGGADGLMGHRHGGSEPWGS